MLWLLSAVIGNQAASQHIADARVPEHACGSNTLGGWGDMMQSRPAWHTVRILHRLRRQSQARNMPTSGRRSRPVARARARAGPGPSRAAHGAMRKTPQGRSPLLVYSEGRLRRAGRPLRPRCGPA